MKPKFDLLRILNNCGILIAENRKNWPENYKNDPFYQRRFVSVDLINAQLTYQQIKELTGVSISTLSRWWDVYQKGGYCDLAALPKPGRQEGIRPPRRTTREPTPRLWGQSRVLAKQEVIRRHFEEGHSQNKIAREMNIRTATVNAWVRRYREEPETFLQYSRRDYSSGRPKTIEEALANLEAGRTRLNAADGGLPEPLPLPDWEFEVE